MFRRRNASRKASPSKLTAMISGSLHRAVPDAIGWMRGVMANGSAGDSIHQPNYHLEALEQRRMLTTFMEIGQQGTFDYFSRGGEVDEIAYNDVNFEAIGIIVDPTTGAARLGNLAMAQIVEPTIGVNLYKVYVTESNPDSFISIYPMSALPALGGVPAPLSGGIPGIAVTNAQTGQPYVTNTGGTGSVFIGEVNPVSDPVNQPYTSEPLPRGLGLAPADANETPGIYVQALDAAGTPNNFGNFLVGGVVTGDVFFGGNLNEFYAGAVLTGDLTGDPAVPMAAPTDARTDPNNFQVMGDLREFITNGPVGTDGVGGIGGLAYVTSFDLNVGGKIGELHIGNTEAGTRGSLAGTIEAGNSPLISGQTAYNTSSPANLTGIWTDQLEDENLATPNPGAVFTQGFIDLRNDTAADAQILGSFPVLNATTGLPEKDIDGNIIYQAQVDGNLDTTNGDTADFYGVALEAGVTFTVTLSANDLEVIDPKGNVIASNSKSGIGPQQLTTTTPGLYLFAVVPIGGTGQQYTLNITNVGNLAIGGIETSGVVLNNDAGGYSDIGVNQGIIAGIGDIGAIQLGGAYLSTTSGPTPAAADPLASTTTTLPVTAPTSILVADGNLRSLVASQIGDRSTGDTLVLIDEPTLSVPNGNVGLIQSTASAAVSNASNGVLSFDSQFDPNFENLASPQFVTDNLYATAIGGSIQVIDAATTFEGDVATNAGIGSLIAADMDTDTPSYIDVNADNKGQDGIIDLIDVQGSFGDLLAGGPQFVTHNGGDIRYMLLLGAIFRDEFFGGGAESPVIYNVGQVVHVTDQAGNVLNITPVGPITTTLVKTSTTPAPTNTSTGTTTNSSAGAVTTSVTTLAGPQIGFLGYQIRDKGGQVPVEILSTGSMTISTTGTGPNAAVNVALMAIEGNGMNVSNGALDQFGNTTITEGAPVFTAATNDGTTTTTTTAADGSVTTTTTTISGGGTTTNLSLQLMGNTKINVLDVAALTPGGALLSNPTLIENNTSGEVATFNADNVGTILVHGNLGFTTPVATPAAVEPVGIFQGDPEGNSYPQAQQLTTAGGYPFIGVDTGVDIVADAVNIDAYGGIGNVEVDGTLQSLIANYAVSSHVKHATPIAGQFDGIVGPIEGGFLLNIDIGQGVLPTGTGLVSYSGIYGVDDIGMIDNLGNTNSDIRGNIASEDDAHWNVTAEAYFEGAAIGQIYLANGSIIFSSIDTIFNWNGSQLFDNFAVSGDLGNPFVNPDPQELPFENPYTYEIGSIIVAGDGGIIGTTVSCTNIGPVVVTDGGFGIFDSILDSEDLGRLGGITASGYGIRDSSVTECGYLGPVDATGNGNDISVLDYPIDVRESDLPNTLDPYFGIFANVDTDINAQLGTSVQTPIVPNETDSGVIEDDVFQGQESLTSLTADKIRTAEPLYTNAETGTVEPTPTVPNIPFIGVDYPMELNFATSIGNIHINQQVDGLQITTGTLTGFYSGVSVNRLGISTAGEVDAMLIKGNLGNFITDEATGQVVPDSYINAGGASGILGNIRVLGNVNANLSATGVVKSIIITGDLLGSLTAEGQSTSYALDSLIVYGGIRDNSLVLDGSVGSIIVDGTLGTSAGTLYIAGSANLISVGANNRQKGSTLGLVLNVLGTIGTLRVHGTITNTVTTGGDLTNLIVTGDGTNPNIITSPITVGGRIYKATVTNGNVDASITANGFINSFTINHGSLIYGSTVQSVLDSIRSFNITGGAAYGLYGSLLGTNGFNFSMNISGNVGDGTDPVNISAQSGTNIIVNGTITDHTTIAIASQLNLLKVNGDIQAGVVISAHPLVTQKIKGTNNGNITIV